MHYIKSINNVQICSNKIIGVELTQSFLSVDTNIMYPRIVYLIYT